MARMQTKNDMDEVFEDYCIDDGHLRYIPRNQLMNAMHMLGLNPTVQNLEEIVPEGDEDTRVRYEEFYICYEAVKHTRGYNRDELISAFRVFDDRGTGKLTTAEFLRAMGSSEDELQGYEQQELLEQADPHQTGWVDYVAFANLLCPTRRKSKKHRRSVEPLATPAHAHREEEEEEAEDSPHREEIVERHVETPIADEPERDIPVPPVLGDVQDKRKAAISSLIRDLNITAEQEEQVRSDQKKKLEKWAEDMKSAYDKRRSFRGEEVRPSLRSSDDDINELRETLKQFNKHKEECKASLEAQADLLTHKRNRADNDLKAALEKYRSDPDYSPVIETIEDILICKHRIVSNTWTPLCLSKSGEGVDQFLSACGGSHPDGRDRGSTPSDVPVGGSEAETDSFHKGAYLHHGTSSYWDSGTRHSNLLPAEVQELCSEHTGTSAAIRLLKLPCILDSSKCGIDDVSEDARQKRAAFFDGVNGSDYSNPEGYEDSNELVDLYNCGVWIRNNAKENGDLQQYSCSYHLLKDKWQCERNIVLVESAADEYTSLVEAVDAEEAALDAIRKDADRAVELCKKNWKTEMEYHEEDYESEREQIKNSALREVAEDAVGTIPGGSSSSSKPPASSTREERTTSTKVKPSPRKEVPAKKGGGCCS